MGMTVEHAEEPIPHKEELLKQFDELHRFLVERALETGKVIKFDKRTEGQNNRDLVVEIVIRHNNHI